MTKEETALLEAISALLEDKYPQGVDYIYEVWNFHDALKEYRDHPSSESLFSKPF